jgi:hypothetical protein
MRDDAGSSANWICVSQILPLSVPRNDGEAVGCHSLPQSFLQEGLATACCRRNSTIAPKASAGRKLIAPASRMVPSTLERRGIERRATGGNEAALVAESACSDGGLVRLSRGSPDS